MFVNNHRTVYKETVRNARGTYGGRFLQDVWNLGWYMHTCIHNMPHSEASSQELNK